MITREATSKKIADVQIMIRKELYLPELVFSSSVVPPVALPLRIKAPAVGTIACTPSVVIDKPTREVGSPLRWPGLFILNLKTRACRMSFFSLFSIESKTASFSDRRLVLDYGRTSWTLVPCLVFTLVRFPDFPESDAREEGEEIGKKSNSRFNEIWSPLARIAPTSRENGPFLIYMCQKIVYTCQKMSQKIVCV